MTGTIVMERDLAHPVEKVWRAITESHLLADWLMANDFRAEVGHRFTFRHKPLPHWNGITDCEVTEVTPMTCLAYRWQSSGNEAATGVQTLVTWTLHPTATGTRLRMEQSGFRPDQTQALGGAGTGWRRFLAQLDDLLHRIETEKDPT
jgi:uncharacterized protein YndB with AHSA1/START domain